MQTGHIFISYRLPPLEIFLIIVILWYTHSLTSIPAVKRPGPGSGELWSLMVWNKYVFIRCIISASGLWVVFITLNSIEPYFCGLDCLQWVLLSIYLFYFIDEARIFVLTRNILFFLSFLKICQLQAGRWGWCMQCACAMKNQRSKFPERDLHSHHFIRE